ncbi:MAG TPA: hypothetical protein VGF89_07655 [Steroidobacteraceae bacterium]|jgi:hypothetical protein
MRPQALPGPDPGASNTVAVAMDREFIARNQIVERYLGGRLPLKGMQDFERYCRENPDLVDELGLSERVSAALRLVDASGRAMPWEQPAKRWWEKSSVLLAGALLTLALGVTCLALQSRSAGLQRQLATLQHRLTAQPLDPATSTRTITVIPSRTGPMRQSVVGIGGADAQMADLKFDLSWSAFSVYRVIIERVDQGRAAVLHDLQRDSAGNVHIEINSTALGPGDYQFSFEGLTWRGEPVPQAWATITVVH